jgi:predicted phage terminase large subunit-like protein
MTLETGRPDDSTLTNADTGYSDADLAAFAARRRWLTDAWDRKSKPEYNGKQIPPETTPRGLPWSILLWRCGRGFGKTKAISEWLWWELWQVPELIGHYLAATSTDVEGTIFEGVSGLQAVVPAECLRGASWAKAYRAGKRPRLYLANGSMIKGFATFEEGERMRGPQCHRLGGDEFAAWDRPAGNAEKAFDNAMFGVRLKSPDGSPARAVFGTTPKPNPFLKNLEKRPDVITITGSTYENLPNLDPAFRNTILSKEGTQIGKQEIHGEYLDDQSGAIIKRGWFRLWPYRGLDGKIKKFPEFSYVLISLDTASEEENYDWDAKKREVKIDYTAATVWGIFNTKQCFTAEELRRLQVRHPYAAVLLDCWAIRYGFPDLLEKAREMMRTKYGANPGRKPDIMLIENKSSGIQLRQMMVNYGAPTWPYNPGNMSKTMRLHAASPYIKQGGLFIPESTVAARLGQPRDWVEPFLDQVTAFQGEGSTEYDDYVDSLSQAVIYLGAKSFLAISPQELPDPDPEEKKAEAEEAAKREREREKARINPYGV